jgi:hypothetical protein
MRINVLAVAAVAAFTLSVAASADQIANKTGAKTGFAIMTDSELDSVVAGVPALTVHGVGNTPGGVLAGEGNVVLGGSNAQGAPKVESFPPTAFGGHAPQSAKPCIGC